ncbi:MAG: GNAT family N-acetyltransferase [Geminicoccaceae bacterium]
MTTSIRDLVPDDLGWLLALNNAAVPHVNQLDRPALADLLAITGYARAVLDKGEPQGALLAFWPGADYASAHYRWFEQRFRHFLYVDRVMIASTARGSGLGRILYDDLEQFARAEGSPRIALEVNRQPPNPGSLAFHERLGFKPVGELAHDREPGGGDPKRVVLMVKPLENAPAA